MKRTILTLITTFTIIVIVVGGAIAFANWFTAYNQYYQTFQVLNINKQLNPYSGNFSPVEVGVYKDGNIRFLKNDTGLENVKLGDSIRCMVQHYYNQSSYNIYFVKKKGI